MRPIAFGPQVCTDLAGGSTREWLLPDGLGGYAMGTVTGLRTRRYHGLLVVAGTTPASRMLGLASLDAVVTLPSGARVRLGGHEWAGGVIEPRGHELLTSFELIDGVPRWRWRIGDVVVEREIAAVHGRAAVTVVHRQITGGPVRITLEALCAWRNAHGEQGPSLSVAPTADGCIVENAYRIAGPGFASAGEWFQGVRYREERARGLQDQENLWYAGSFHAELESPVEVVAWAGDLASPPAPGAVGAARRRHREVVAAAAPADSTEAALALAADAFVIKGPDVVAGYPWFGAWSRDTMISYEGLFLSCNRAAEGRELLRSYAATLSEGMLANTADTGDVEYNTADGTLWFLHAVDRHVTVTGDDDLFHELYPDLRGVIEHHLAGTRYGIQADPADGLLTQGVPGEALTWMDARVDGVAVTPRTGKAVDINALWINALAPLGFESLHAQARDSFERSFPTLTGQLQDVLGDHTLRPNQLLAWSLPHAPLRPDPAVLGRIGAALLTPMGLRSQAPGTPGYHGRHAGGPGERDRAYHTGTVWPWLTGPYADAWHRLGTGIPDVLADAERHLTEYGLGSISETAGGDAPHPGTGCPFQAWSVAEQLRARKL
ncbi:amylo-alpha-1,6-glucosidase [Actinoplanes sp. NPDC020271]|uniref:amylo-alpha-1,6-glucosidase n=1 Tax=Actinoplanes sp. NPDC020271 TaxID=3363896 RepID=UPI00379AB8F8